MPSISTILIISVVCLAIALIAFFVLRGAKKSGADEEKVEVQNETISNVKAANSAILEFERSRSMRDKLMRKYTRE